MPRASASWAVIPRFWRARRPSTSAAVLLAPERCWSRRTASTWPGLRLTGGVVGVVAPPAGGVVGGAAGAPRFGAARGGGRVFGSRAVGGAAGPGGGGGRVAVARGP